MAKSITSEIDREKTLAPVYWLLRLFVPSEIEKEAKKDALGSISPDAITTATGIPYSAVAEAAVSLRHKLDVNSSTGLFSTLKNLIVR